MNARAWADKRAMRDRALVELGRLPDSETGHGAAVPFPFVDRGTYHQGLGNKEINRAIREAPVAEVPLDGLKAIQHSVKKDRVAQYIENPHIMKPGELNPESKTPIDYPVVMERDGVRYIHDGHHRLTAEKLQGKQVGKVRLVKLPDQK